MLCFILIKYFTPYCYNIILFLFIPWNQNKINFNLFYLIEMEWPATATTSQTKSIFSFHEINGIDFIEKEVDWWLRLVGLCWRGEALAAQAQPNPISLKMKLKGSSTTNSNSHLSLITQLKKFSWLMEEMELVGCSASCCSQRAALASFN